MAGEWKEVRLGDLSDVITKGTTPTSLGFRFTDTGINFVKSESVTFDGWIDRSKFARIDAETHCALKRSQLKEGDVLFSMAGVYIGKTAVVPKAILPANTNQAVGIVRLDQSRAHPRFIDYFLRNPSYNLFINNLVSQSAQPNLNLAEIRNLPITLPPLAEQKRIAEILGALDDKIELNRKMNATLEAMARALFQSWFVDFDPVRRNADKNTQKKKAKSEMPQTCATSDANSHPSLFDPSAYDHLFPDEFQDSEIGHIPKGWAFGTVSDTANFSRASVNPSLFSNEVFDHYSLPAYDEGRMPKAEMGYTIKSNKLVVTKGSVLLSKLNPHIPRIWLPDLRSSRRSVCSTEFIVATANSGYSSEFLFSLFTNTTFASTYSTLVTGTTGSHQRIRPNSVLEIKIPIPPSQLVEAFTILAKSIYEKINKNIHQSNTLSVLRDTLLPKLMSGELSVNSLDDFTV